MEGFKGIFTAVLTPFDNEGKINEKALERLLEMNIKKGVTGFYVGGSTAEAFLMSADERKKLLELTVQIVNGRAKIISHIGCISTDAAIDLERHAEAHGADIISSVAPFYYKFSFEEIKSYYYDIVNSVSKPMLIYNFPSFSGVTLGVEEVAQFLEDDRFVGVKHTSNNFFDLERFKAAYPGKLFYNGFDEMFLSGMAMGADGGVGSTYNFMAEKFVKMYKLCGEGKFAEAKKIQAEANRIIKILIKVGVFAGEKAVLELMGIEMGGCRRPFKSAVTAAQSIKHTLPDFDKAEFVGKYKINDFVSRGINIGILSKTRRAAVSVYPDRLALRTYNYKESKVDFMNVANVATEKGKWYTLKIVMELYDAATSDYRYAVYRKADGVAAAIEASSGRIYTGVCVDGACTLGICAERNAIFNMLTNGEDEIRRVIAVNWDGRAMPPCGACRELMTQLMPDSYEDIEIMLDCGKNEIAKLGELTPKWWI